MGRSERNTNAKGSSKEAVASTSANGSTISPADLLAKAEAILTDTGDASLAVKFAERAASNSQELSQEDQIKLSELLGLCALENGDDEKAKAVSALAATGVYSRDGAGFQTNSSCIQYFESCSKHSSLSLLYVAQLADSPEEALASFRSAVELLSSKLDLSTPSEPHGKEKVWSTQEKENRVQITRALVGMTELYLTDLW